MHSKYRQKPELIFEPLNHSHLPVLKSWFSDPDTKKWAEEPADWGRNLINKIERRAFHDIE